MCNTLIANTQITKIYFIFPLTRDMPRAVFKYSIAKKIHSKAKLRLEASEWCLHEDNALLISSKLEPNKSEDKISSPNLYSHIQFNRKTEAGFFQIWKNFKSIHFSTPPFFLGVAKYSNVKKKKALQPSQTQITEVLAISQVNGPLWCEFLGKINLENQT